MRSFLSSILAFLAIGTVLTPETASALEIFANGGVGNAGVTIGSETAISTGVAQGFTVGPANTNNLLTSITLGLAIQDVLQPNLGNLVFALYSSSASLPNAEIARFASVPNGGWGTGVAAEYTFNFASGTQELSLNTSYWIVATYENLTYTPASTTPTMEWRDSNPGVTPSGQPGADITYLGTANRPTGFGAWATSTDDRFASIRINAVVVPEPSTYALGAVSVLALGTVARRRTRKALSA